VTLHTIAAEWNNPKEQSINFLPKSVNWFFLKSLIGKRRQLVIMEAKIIPITEHGSEYEPEYGCSFFLLKIL